MVHNFFTEEEAEHLHVILFIGNPEWNYGGSTKDLKMVHSIGD